LFLGEEAEDRMLDLLPVHLYGEQRADEGRYQDFEYIASRAGVKVGVGVWLKRQLQCNYKD